MPMQVRAAATRAMLLAFSVFWSGSPICAGPEQEAKEKARFTNRLAKETSPYLLLHAHNPVDWYPWGPEAFAKAKAEGKPIFLSVGYSSCYWCHVMERESFSDPAIAKVLNERFVCVKVDKEERPDVDQVYMTALLALGQGGGWPMSMFLTSDGRPFFGGTYFPPRDREGREGFMSLLDRVFEAWRDQRDALEHDASRLSEATRRVLERSAALRKVPLERTMTAAGQAALAVQFDPEYGGFGYEPLNPRKPKFPEPSNLLFLLERHSRSARAGGEAGPKATGPAPLVMVERTLDHLARGGIRDHLAGGYHRYSTERTWTVPHFEKMLYDNAQLATVYLLAFEATADPRWRAEAEATFAFVARSLTGPEGGFYAALDAEVAGEEGQYYVWTRAEVRRVLGSDVDFDLFARVYGLDRDPNFEGGRYVLFEPLPRTESAKALGLPPDDLAARLAPLRAKLLAEREKRAGPLRDDKVLTAWNGLMIAAYAEGYRVLKDPRYRAAAEKAADFLLASLRTADGRLLRTYRAGKAKLPAYLEDYAFLAHGLLRLHAATADPKRLDQARAVVDRMLADFADPKDGGFFFTASDHESLFSKAKEPYDTAIPSGNSMAIRCLIALAQATGEARYLDRARQTLTSFSSTLAENPTGAPFMLLDVDEYLDALAAQPAGAGVEPGPVATAAVPAPGPAAKVVSAKAAIEKTEKPLPGGEVRAMLTLTIQDGWHIYANEPGSEVVKPTQVEMEPSEGLSLARVEYPPGEVKALDASGSERVAVYEKKATFKLFLRVAPGTKPGLATVRFKVRFQACNDSACLAPATLSVPLELTIAAP
jgi:uncharacterized protein